jgi:hypothetical protein
MSPSISTSRIGKLNRETLNHPAPRYELPVVSRNLILRRAGVLAAAITAGVLATAAPALADATVSPPSAAQGSGENLYFTVTNTGTSPITTVKLNLPADTPVAEVFPLSVDNWAPQLTPLKLTTPLTSIHAASPVTETASAVTWTAVDGKAIPPGGSAELAVALGPLPMTSTMSFTLEPTYAGGSGPALAPVVLNLTPAAPGQQTGGHHGGGTTGGSGGDVSDAEDAVFQAIVDQADDGPGFWTIAGWVVAALALAAAAVAMLRGRHRASESDEAADDEPGDDEAGDDEPDDDKKQPVGATSNWRYTG